MSEFFAEATVRLTPDLTGFVTELRKDVKAAVERVEGTPAARVRIAPALTRDFVGNLRKQVNIAVAQAQRGIKPIQVRAVLTDVSRAAIAREIRSGAQTVRTTAPSRGARAGGTGAAVASTRDLATATLGLASAEKLFSQAARDRIPLLGALSAEESALAKVRAQGARASELSAKAASEDAVATGLLAQAKRDLAVAEQFAVGSSTRAKFIREADIAAVRALTAAQESGDEATQRSATAFRGQIRQLEGASGALDETSRAAQRAASNMSQLRRGVLSTSLSFLGIRGATLAASARFLAGAAAIAVFAKALQSATQFSTQMNVFRATTSATASELERVRDAARALGADITLPGVSAADAGESMVELAKAGLSVQDSIDGARGVLQLATAAAIENAQAVELAANAINAFQLVGRDATRVADTFANAANAAQGSIVDIGIAFQQASAAGRQVGLSFEDTTTFLTVLARNGLRGSDAGTSLRTALIRLIRPTKEAQAALKELGVSTRDAAGNLRPDIFIQLTEATKGLSPAARDAKLALIGGQDAFRAITILGRQSIDEFIKLRQELREQGTAAELAAARAEGLQGAIDALSNTLSTAGLRVGKAFTPAIQGIVEGLTGASASLASSGAAAELFGGSVEFLESTLAGLGQTLQAIGTVVGPAASGLTAIANSLGVANILAAVAAYKLLPAIFVRIQTTAAIATTAITLMSLQGINPARAAITALAGSFNIWAVAAAAVGAGLFYLLTQETAAERATRKLKDATDELTSALERRNQAVRQRRDAPLLVSGAQLGVLEAEQAAARARAAAQAAPAGTFARAKAELELQVALDNVTIAQNAYNDAVARSSDAQAAAADAVKAAQAARAEEIRALQETIGLRRDELAAASGSRPVLERAEAFAITKVTEEIQKRAAAAREEDTETSRGLANRLELLAKVTQALNELPDDATVRIALEAPNVAAAGRAIQEGLREAGNEGGRVAVQSIMLGLGILPDRLKNYMDGPVRQALINSAGDRTDVGETMAQSIIQGLQNGLKRLQGQATGLDVQADLATIASGATGAQLPTLQDQLANAQQRESNVRAQIAQSIATGGAGETPTLRRALRQAISDQARIISEIRGVNDQLASEAKSAADAAEAAQTKRFEDILGAMGVKRDKRQQAVEDAQITESLADDVSATRKLRQLAAQQIASLVQRIASARAQGKNVTALIEGLKTLKGIYQDLGREVQNLQRERNQQLRDRVAESIQLNIEHAQITENKSAEIRAREAEIRRLKALQAKEKEGTIEYRRLRNLIAEQNAAIADLKGEQEGADKGTSAFDLLQQNAETFSRISGDLTNFNQPFGEVSDFTVDLASLLTRRPGKAAEVVVKHKRDREVTSIDRLVEALNKNTDALRGEGGPKKKAPKFAGGGAGAASQDPRWVEAQANRRRVHGII